MNRLSGTYLPQSGHPHSCWTVVKHVMREIMHSFLFVARQNIVSDRRVESDENDKRSSFHHFHSPLQGVASRPLECLLEGLYHQLIIGSQRDDGIHSFTAE